MDRQWKFYLYFLMYIPNWSYNCCYTRQCDYLCRGWLRTYISMSNVSDVCDFLSQTLIRHQKQFFLLFSIFVCVLFSHLFFLSSSFETAGQLHSCTLQVVKKSNPLSFFTLLLSLLRLQQKKQKQDHCPLDLRNELRSPSLCHINYRIDRISGLRHNGIVVLLYQPYM